MRNSIKNSITALLVLVGMTVTAQVADTVTIENETINASSDPALLNVTAGQAIIIKPTTWIQPGTVFSASITEDPYISPVLDTNENYVFTRVYQEPMTSFDGVTNNSDVIESISYFDGLGRAKQQVAIKASPDKKDVVTHISYDEYGRQAKQYLPFERQNGALGGYDPVNITDDINNYYQTKYEDDFVGMEVGNVNAYSESIFEPSPLNRVLEQGAPGKDWKADDQVDTDHTIKFDWATNDAEEVVYFKVNFHENNTEVPILVQDGFYDPNELYVTITKDENWQPGQTHPDDHTTREYSDKLGRVVLKRTFNNAEAHDTYYVYDDFGNLTYVIPPKVTTNNGVSNTELAELCYQYKYDSRNRLVEKKIPGKGWEYIIYNKLDQPILTQDAVQRSNREWLYTKYDAFGRVVFTGLEQFPWDTTRAGLQNNLDNDTIPEYEDRTDGFIDVNGTILYYSNNTFPGGGDILTINYYDKYTFDLDGMNKPTMIDGIATSNNVKGLPTGSKVRVLGTDSWITTVTAYDAKGRVIWTGSRNDYLDTTDFTEVTLDFVGKPIKTKTTHTKGNNAPIVTTDTFTYDHIGRLLTQKQQINSQPEELIVHNVYDELGQLETKKVGNAEQAPLQTVDYKYNVRGWLTDINDVNAIGDDLFSYKISYNNPASGVTPLYNGNISTTEWRTANDNVHRWYKYEYDALNRLTDANNSYNNYSLNGITYDKNGNIETLNRRGWQNNGNNANMDVLDYEYNIGNKLQKVTDNGNDTYGFKDGANTNNDYVYDVNGNLTVDRNKGITDIKYNHLNLPTRVTVNHGSFINYTYDATGSKLRKQVSSGNITHYAGNHVYETIGGVGTVLRFFNHPEGYVEPENDGTFSYIYQHKDHLGNIRLSYSDKDNDGQIDVLRNNSDVDGDGDNAQEILEEKNYYPFGLEHKGYNNTITGREHPYKFNGIEHEQSLGLDLYEMPLRQYDPAIARWTSIDPVTHHSMSPYVAFDNNPVFWADPSGASSTRQWMEKYGVTDDDLITIYQAPSDNESAGCSGDQCSCNGSGKCGNTAHSSAGRKVTHPYAGYALPTGGYNSAMRGGNPWEPTQEDIDDANAAVGQTALFFLGEWAVFKVFQGGAWVYRSVLIGRGTKATMSSSKFVKLLQPVDEFDEAVTLFRGTTGSEAGSSSLFLTDNATVAATYIKNGGQVVSYRVSQYALKFLEQSGSLNLFRGIHKATGKINNEFQFIGKELVEAMNKLANPLK